MKLYTEFEIKDALDMKAYIVNGKYLTDDEILHQLTPIELPSDEEIKENADKYTIDNNTYYSFINGAKWMKEKYLTKTNNMKTAMQELRDDLSQIFHENQIPLKIDMTKYLEKEKEDLMKAFSDGQETPINHPTLPHYSREEYYNDNYNQD